MAKQRVLILSPDPKQIESRVRGPSVLGGLRGGASEIIFEENLERELLPTLEKYLFLGHGLLRKMSLDELFDYCFPVITTTDMDLLGYTVVEMFKESLGASFGVLFREPEGRGTGFSILATAGFPDDSIAGVFLPRLGAGIAKLTVAAPARFPAERVARLTPDDEAMLGEN